MHQGAHLGVQRDERACWAEYAALLCVPEAHGGVGHGHDSAEHLALDASGSAFWRYCRLASWATLYEVHLEAHFGVYDRRHLGFEPMAL